MYYYTNLIVEYYAAKNLDVILRFYLSCRYISLSHAWVFLSNLFYPFSYYRSALTILEARASILLPSVTETCLVEASYSISGIVEILFLL
jgi:hypothetical protein